MSTVNDHSAFYVVNLDKAENPVWDYRLYRSERIPLLDLCYIVLRYANLSIARYCGSNYNMHIIRFTKL